MLDRPFRAEIGPYWLLLPEGTKISAGVSEPTSGAYQIASTMWTVSLRRFQIFIHLDPIHDLDRLKWHIDHVTKSEVVTPSPTVNGVPGVTHGDYGPPRTWIDWWFKKGDTMICLCLQSKSFPCTKPTEEEIAEHNAIMHSLKYCRDFSFEPPPLP